MTRVPMKRWPREDRDRDWNYLPRNIWGYQKLEEARTDPPWRLRGSIALPIL